MLLQQCNNFNGTYHVPQLSTVNRTRKLQTSDFAPVHCTVSYFDYTPYLHRLCLAIM